MGRIAERLRSDEPFSEKLNEAAAEELDRLEAELAAAYAELRKQHPVIKAVFDPEVWANADAAIYA